MRATEGPRAAKGRLPANPTPAQKKAAEALSLTPKQQAVRWSTHSGASERLLATHTQLDRLVRARFPHAEDVFEYNMRGWAIRRRTDIRAWQGTIDPNWIRLYVAERKAGITIHVWNPYDPMALERDELREAGFKTMVGCLQFNRKGELPVGALGPLLDAMQKAWQRESRPL